MDHLEHARNADPQVPLQTHTIRHSRVEPRIFILTSSSGDLYAYYILLQLILFLAPAYLICCRE